MDRSGPVRVVGISGSLRRSSSNSALIDAAARLAPAGVEVVVFDALGTIPPFDPDHDEESPPEPVASLRRMLIACDAVMIASPEYAHGVPGVLKNALDWVVASGELVGKPIALINTSSRATHAWASLLEILTTMSACVVREASLTISLQGRMWCPNDIVDDVERSRLVRSAMEALAADGDRAGTGRGQVGDCPRPVPLTVSDDPALEDLRFLEEQINEYNFATSGIDDARLLAIVLRDPAGRIYAGLTGHTWGGVCEVRFLWVDEARRHGGIGSRLLRAAEEEAITRGCTKIVLSTHTFQAPDFYRKHGYVITGEFADYPRGHKSIFLEKPLNRSPASQY